MLAASEENVPGGHLKQPAPAGAPERQAGCTLSTTRKMLPGVPAAIPETLLKDPAGQGTQKEDPGEDAAYPKGQYEQDDAGLMVELRYVLTEQFWTHGGVRAVHSSGRQSIFAGEGAKAPCKKMPQKHPETFQLRTLCTCRTGWQAHRSPDHTECTTPFPAALHRFLQCS